MNDRPAVCVIVPVYRAEKTLDRCVQSIVSQAVDGGLVCVLIEDGSPDASAALCDAWAARDARVRVVHKAHGGGPSGARNAGLDAADADWVVFLDADDALRPGALQAALTVQAADPGGFVLWAYTEDEQDPASVRSAAEARPQSALARLWMDCRIAMPWNKLYRADLARRLRFDPAYTLGEDLQYVLDYIAQLGREQPDFHYAVMPSALTFYDCSRSDTLSTKYHADYCDIWPRHFAKLNAACAAAGAPPADMLPLHRAELKILAEGAADILRRGTGTPAERRRKARAALTQPWMRALLAAMRAEHSTSPYYLPCLLGSVRLTALAAEDTRLRGRLDWLSYYLYLGRRARE